VPFAARPAARRWRWDALDQISAGAFLGSLLAVLVLVAVPVLLLGTVSPWAIRLGVRSVEEAGTRGRGGCTRCPRRARWSARSCRRSC
jgi:hypothetical protein